MERVIAEYIDAIEFGDVKVHRNMAVVPLFVPGNNVPPYLTLKAALGLGVLLITEVSAGGSVPELLAKNEAGTPVLLLDGEELAGAKQNRVLTVLRGLRRTEAAARAHLLESEPDEAAWKEFCREKDQQGDE